ncbi:MAG TPA: cupredoxin domain-containing protein [Drouetiella sp.]
MKNKLLAFCTICGTALMLDFAQRPSVAATELPTAVVTVAAKKFTYSPQFITLKKGVPVVLKLSTEDRSHGFNAPALNLRADIEPGKVTELKVTPKTAGEYDFFCDIFCGSGHEGMAGKIKVVE